MAQGEAPNIPRGNTQFVDKDGMLTPEGLLLLEQYWRQIAAGFVTVPCVASGANLITLTPTLHREGARTYADHMVFAAVAAATSTDAVTAKVADAAGNALATLKVYVDGGATQAGTGDVVADRLYFFVYAAALDGGAGGLVLK